MSASLSAPLATETICTPYLITGYLLEKSKRFEDFVQVFGSNLVPLQSGLPHLATLPGRGAEAVYLLDLGELTIAQFERLCDFLSERFGTPRDLVPDILREEGMPVLAQDLVVYAGRSDHEPP